MRKILLITLFCITVLFGVQYHDTPTLWSADGDPVYEPYSTIYRNVFYPASEAADQGKTTAANGDGYLTIKQISDDIGTTEDATIVLRHDGVADQTRYGFSTNGLTNDILTKNIAVIVEPGAIIRMSAGIDLYITGDYSAAKVTAIEYGGAGTGRVYFNYSITNAGRTPIVYPEWWGAVADGLGNTANTTPINNAILSFNGIGGTVQASSGEYDINATISMANGVYLRGVPPTSSRVYDATVWTSSPNAGTWFVNDGTAYVLMDFDGIRYGGVSDIGFWEDQGTPGGGWTITAYQPVIDIDNGAEDLLFEDLYFLNNYHAIRQNGPAGTAGGRYAFNRIYGQPLRYGVQFLDVRDVTYFDNIHFWPFWTNHNTIMTETKTNGIAFHFYRADNPKFTNIFAIEYRAGMWFSHNAATGGDTKNVHLTNVDFDICKYGIILDSISVDVTMSLNNFSVNSQADTWAEMADSIGIYMDGNGGRIQGTNIYLDNQGDYGIFLDDGSNILQVDNVHIVNWDPDSAGEDAISISSGSTAYIGSQRLFSGGGGGDDIGGAGTIIKSGEFSSWATGLSANQEYTATFDLIVAVIIICTTGGDAAAMSLETPTGSARQIQSCSNAVYDRASATMPVRRGDTWKVVTAGTYTAITVSAMRARAH